MTMPLGLRRAGAAIALGLTVFAAPSGARAQEASSEPASEASVPRPSEPALSRVQTGGLVLFGVSYGIALGVPSVAGFSEGREWFALPLAGPVIGLARGAPISPWPVVFDEIGQLGGLTLLVAGDRVSWGSTASVTRCRHGGVCVGAGGYF